MYDDKCNLVEFRQMFLSLTLNQVKFYNCEQIDFTRVLARIFIIHA
jgi:hypothetical protein